MVPQPWVHSMLVFRNHCLTQYGFVIVKDRIKEEIPITLDFNPRVNHYFEL